MIITESKLTEKFKDQKIITVEVNDQDDQLSELINYIKSSSSGGHSFIVVVDPENELEKEFFIDGDGSFRITDISVESK